MLKDPKFNSFRDDPMMQILGMSAKPTRLEAGVFVINHHNFGDMLVKNYDFDDGYDAQYPCFEHLTLSSYGVCDSPEQFMAEFREALQTDERTFAIGFTHVAKNPENAGQGGGWRWHKWGPYLGSGEPTTEYLDDEEKFNEGVYVYHIEQIAGPIYKYDFATGKMSLKEKKK